MFGWTFVPRYLELQFVESKATKYCILIVLGEVPLLWEQGALMNRLLLQYKVKRGASLEESLSQDMGHPLKGGQTAVGPAVQNGNRRVS